jgi:hypothetical protein
VQEVWGTSQQQLCNDLSRLVRRYDRDVNGSWSFREFISFCSPLTQYSLKAKDLSTALVLGGDAKKEDKQLLAETSSSASLDELNAMLAKKRPGKENKLGGGALSKATKSTAAMSYAGGHESFIKG